jgi:hypothetical protein
MQRVLDRPVFTVEDATFRWCDVVAAASEWGEWERLEHTVWAGMELVDIAERRGDAPTAEELGTLAGEFRYERGLLSADETERWLERWGLDLDGWFDYLRRSLLRAREPARNPEGRPAPPRLTTWTEAVCSGELERLARALADRAAIYAAVEDQPPTLERLAAMEERFERFVADATTPRAVDDELAANVLDWTRLDCAWIETSDEAVAREAALCVIEDGRELAEVTREAGLAADDRQIYLGRAGPELASHLIGARSGDLLGPLATDGRFLLILVRDRTPPSSEDAELCALAERRLAERAVERETLRRVRFHDSH